MKKCKRTLRELLPLPARGYNAGVVQFGSFKFLPFLKSQLSREDHETL